MHNSFCSSIFRCLIVFMVFCIFFFFLLCVQRQLRPCGMRVAELRTVQRRARAYKFKHLFAEKIVMQ